MKDWSDDGPWASAGDLERLQRTRRPTGEPSCLWRLRAAAATLGSMAATTNEAPRCLTCGEPCEWTPAGPHPLPDKPEELQGNVPSSAYGAWLCIVHGADHEGAPDAPPPPGW